MSHEFESGQLNHPEAFEVLKTLFHCIATLYSNLQSRRYFLENIADLYQSLPVGSKAWQAFREHWNKLDQEKYMADGTYRPTQRTVKLLLHMSFRQAKIINYLNEKVGGPYCSVAIEGGEWSTSESLNQAQSETDSFSGRWPRWLPRSADRHVFLRLNHV